METLLLQKMFGRIIKGCTRAHSRYIMNEKGGEDKGRGRYRRGKRRKKRERSGNG